MLLALAGLSGLLSYLVAGRRREIGLRIALGADRRRVVRMVIGSGLRPVLVGVVLGLAVLANASMLVAVPLVVVWIANGGVRAGRGFAPAAAALAAAALTVAPATFHNW
jgi:ABC-type antimicrobial peptide transport system permease subunit